MKRKGGFLFLLFGLALAAIVALSVQQMTTEAEAKKIELVDVVVVTQDVPERTVLTPTMLTVRKTVPEALPLGALTQPTQAEGRMTRTSLFAGEALLPSKLVETNGKSGLTYALEPGQVAITFPASDILTTGAVRPGDRVDLLFTLKPDDKSAKAEVQANQGGVSVNVQTQNGPITQTSMQNLRVVGIGSVNVHVESADKAAQATGQPSQGQLITFAVNHQDALTLKAIKDSERFKVEMVLRAAGDNQTVETDPVTIDRIIEQYNVQPAQ